MHATEIRLLDGRIAWQGLKAACRKLDPRVMLRNPVMFVTEVVALLTTVLFVADLIEGAPDASLLPDSYPRRLPSFFCASSKALLLLLPLLARPSRMAFSLVT